MDTIDTTRCESCNYCYQNMDWEWTKGGLTMSKLKLKPCRKCKTTTNLNVLIFLETMCKIECSKCGTATKWQKSMEEAENTWNRKQEG